MDLNDIEKEIMQIRKKNHTISNLLMSHEAQFEELNKMKSDISDIKGTMHLIMDSLSGGLKGAGIINRVEILEEKNARISYWLGVIAATVLGLALKQGYSFVFQEKPTYKSEQAVVRADTDLKIESKEEDKKL